MILNRILKRKRKAYIIPKRRITVEPRHNTKDLLYNHLNKTIQRFLKPLNLLQNLFLIPKYKIRHNFITANGLISKIMSFCIRLLFITLFIQQLIFTDGSFYSNINKTLHFLDQIDSYLLIMSFILFYIQSIFYSSENVQVIVLIKEISGLIKIKAIAMKKLILCNWIIFVLSLVDTFVLHVLFHVYYNYFDIYDIVYDIFVTIMHLSIVYTMRIIKLLKIFLDDLTARIGSIADDSNTEEVNYEDVYIACDKVLKTYRIHTKSFQSQVSSVSYYITCRSQNGDE